MLFDVSYSNPETTQMINQLVGKPFSLRERLKMWTVGSQRFVMTESCDYLVNRLHPDQQRFCNIGLRPRGIQIWCWYKLHTYLLALPFQSLKVKVIGQKLRLDCLDLWFVLEPAHRADLNLRFLAKIEHLSPASFENFSSR